MAETIDRAAIRAGDIIFKVKRPYRHHHVLGVMRLRNVKNPQRATQGFVTSTGRFVDRIEARRIAHDAGQLLPTASKGDRLFTEDLW